MVLAKTARAEAHLNAQFRARTTRKTYVALLHGTLRGGGGGERAPRQPGGEATSQPGAVFIDAPIGRDPARAGRVTCDATAVGAKLAQVRAPLLSLTPTLIAIPLPTLNPSIALYLPLTLPLTLTLALALAPTLTRAWCMALTLPLPLPQTLTLTLTLPLTLTLTLTGPYPYPYPYPKP